MLIIIWVASIDIFILDVQLLIRDGYQTISLLDTEYPDTKILLLNNLKDLYSTELHLHYYVN